MPGNHNYWTTLGARRFSRRRAIALMGSGAVAAYLAACGDDDDGDRSEPSSNTAPAGSPTAAASGTPNPADGVSAYVPGKYGGKLTVAQTLETGTLDPHLPFSGGDAPYINLFYNGLVELNKLTPDPVVSLAKSWEIADSTTIVFTLRDGVKFHDGTDFNAEAVKYNLERILDPAQKATRAAQLASIDQVQTPDARTVRLVLKRPDAPLLFNLAGGYGSGIISPAAIDAHGDALKANPVGTGPFTFQEWVAADHVTGKRNPNYWDKDSAGHALPYLDEVTVRPIPDSTVLYANLQTGDIQGGSPAAKDVAAASKNSDLQLLNGVPGGSVPAVIHLNTAMAPMDNADLRRAMLFAIDTSVITKNIYFDLTIPAEAGLITPDTWAYQPTPGRPTYDLDKAKAYLRAGGKPDGFSIDFIAPTIPEVQQQTEVYIEQWSKIGVKASVTVQDNSTMSKTFLDPAAQSYSLKCTTWGTSAEPDIPASMIYTKDAFYNPMHRALDPRIDDLIVKARQTYDLEERKDLYAQIDQINLVDQCYFVPLLLTAPRYAFRKNVGNVQGAYFYGLGRLQNLFITA